MLPIQSFSTGVLADIVRRQPPSRGRTRFAWQLAVGPALARVTTVELDDGRVLIVQCSDRRWAREVTRAADVVLVRLQQLLGPDAVRRLDVREPAD
jgi:predicted nucleic acid-binding Zn ribbon protein